MPGIVFSEHHVLITAVVVGVPLVHVNVHKVDRYLRSVLRFHGVSADVVSLEVRRVIGRCDLCNINIVLSHCPPLRDNKYLIILHETRRNKGCF